MTAQIIDDHGRSTETAAARTKFINDKHTDDRYDGPTRDDIDTWIKKCFSRDY